MTDRFDTIAGIATPLGEGGVGIVRVSGPGVEALVRRIFRPLGSPPGFLVSHTVQPGFVHHPVSGEALDEVLLVFMRAPRSYTAEDVAEFQGHGGPLVVAAVLEAVLGAGARLAEPGEFTRRAFVNGRLDLAQAEAVADLVCARTEAARRLALEGLGGILGRRVRELAARASTPAAAVEASLDFADDEPDTTPPAALGERAGLLASGLGNLLAEASRGLLVTGGARVVLLGPPNAGKSSLFNALLGVSRAIVTPHPGTTRDTLEGTVEIGGIPVTLVDGAGLRPSDCEIEQEGMRRVTGEARAAALVLLVLDRSAAAEGGDLPDLPPGIPAVLVLAKDDLPPGLDERIPGRRYPDCPIVPVSVLRGTGLDELRRVIGGLLGDAQSGGAGVLVSVRQRDVLRRAHECLCRAAAGFSAGVTPDAVAGDLRGSLAILGEITGETVGEHVLDAVFATFCVGK